MAFYIYTAWQSTTIIWFPLFPKLDYDLKSTAKVELTWDLDGIFKTECFVFSLLYFWFSLACFRDCRQMMAYSLFLLFRDYIMKILFVSVSFRNGFLIPITSNQSKMVKLSNMAIIFYVTCAQFVAFWKLIGTSFIKFSTPSDTPLYYLFKIPSPPQNVVDEFRNLIVLAKIW